MKVIDMGSLGRILEGHGDCGSVGKIGIVMGWSVYGGVDPTVWEVYCHDAGIEEVSEDDLEML